MEACDGIIECGRKVLQQAKDEAASRALVRSIQDWLREIERVAQQLGELHDPEHDDDDDDDDELGLPLL